MNITRINLNNFRNFTPKTQIDLPRSGLLIAAAPNAVGKTNFLESIAVLLRGKTWRAKMGECVKWGEEGFFLEGDMERQKHDDTQVTIYYHQPTKKLRIEEDGVPASPVSFYTHYPFVMLVPEDTFLLSRGPSQRRNFINHVLVSHPGYISSLVQYYRVLRQRNTALKNATSYNDVSVWTDMLAEHASVLWRHRQNLASYWDNKINEMYRKLSSEERRFNISLSPGTKKTDNFKEEIKQAFSFEKRYGHTLYGPHRDDIIITTNDKPVTTTMSRGQLKSLVISLKVLSHHYIKQVAKEEPLLLLDDVLSELDEKRQVALLENLPQTQTILTCTSIPGSLKNRSGGYILDLNSIIKNQPENTQKTANDRENHPEPEEEQVGEDRISIRS